MTLCDNYATQLVVESEEFKMQVGNKICEFKKGEEVPEFLYHKMNCTANFGADVDIYEVNGDMFKYAVYPKKKLNINDEYLIKCKIIDAEQEFGLIGAPTYISTEPKVKEIKANIEN